MGNVSQIMPEYVKYLDLNHRYYIVIALKKEYEDHVFDCQFFDEKGDIKDGYEGMWFTEKEFLLMEEYLFNFISAECDLIITMYEEEYAYPEHLPKVLEITKRMVCESDDKEFIELAEKFRMLVEKAISLNTFVGFCF